MSIFHSEKIINIHTRQSSVINRSITSKYRLLIQEVRDCMSSGWELQEAVDFVINEEFAFMIESDQDKEVLLAWFNGSFGSNQKKVA